MTDQPSPKPRRMLQPSKPALREQLALAADENMRLRAEVERARRRWWHAIVRWVR